nr:hypothetical transcript [Hymenolepis microstoma]
MELNLRCESHDGGCVGGKLPSYSTQAGLTLCWHQLCSLSDLFYLECLFVTASSSTQEQIQIELSFQKLLCISTKLNFEVFSSSMTIIEAFPLLNCFLSSMPNFADTL